MTETHAQFYEGTDSLLVEFEADLPDSVYASGYFLQILKNGTWLSVAQHNFKGESGAPVKLNDPAVGVQRLMPAATSLSPVLRSLASGNHTARVLFLLDGQGVSGRLAKTFDLQVIDHQPLIIAPTNSDTRKWANQTYGGFFKTESVSTDTVSSIQIDWGDGTTSTINGNQGNAWHTYAQPGRYVVQVTAYDNDSQGYLGYYVEVDENPRPKVLSSQSFARPDLMTSGSSALPMDLVVAFATTVPVTSFEWDLDGDRIFETTGGAVQTLLPDADGVYSANLRLFGANGTQAEYRYEFVEAGEVTGVRDEVSKHVPTGTPDGFNVKIAMEIVRQLRPDVYDWWQFRNGVIEKIDAQGWVTGWFTYDVLTYMLSVSGNDRPWIRLHSGMTAGEAAAHIIHQADTGTWFASEFLKDKFFRPDKDLIGAGDFSTVEAFAKWQKWYAKECARTGKFAYQVVTSWYSFQFTGVEFVMTAVDAQQNGLNWTHALDAIRVLPFLSQLDIPVIIKKSDGSEYGRVVRTAKGVISFTKAGGGLYNVADIFADSTRTATKIENVGKSVLSQVTHNRCGETCLEMLLNDWGIDPKLWSQALKSGDAGTSADDLVSLIKASVGSSTGRVANAKAWRPVVDAQGYVQQLGMTIGQLQKACKDGSVIVQIKPIGLTDQHWVIVDGMELLDDGSEVFKIRDPGTGDAWRVGWDEFTKRFTDAGGRAVTF